MVRHSRKEKLNEFPSRRKNGYKILPTQNIGKFLRKMIYLGDVGKLRFLAHESRYFFAVSWREMSEKISQTEAVGGLGCSGKQPIEARTWVRFQMISLAGVIRLGRDGLVDRFTWNCSKHFNQQCARHWLTADETMRHEFCMNSWQHCCETVYLRFL